MKDFLNAVNECKDIETLQNVVSILFEGMQKGMKDTSLFATIKTAYSELVGCHYCEELAELYYSCEGLDNEVYDAAKLSYTQDIQASYPDVTLYDWIVLYGRISKNTKGADSIIEACKVFLNNKFSPYFDID